MEAARARLRLERWANGGRAPAQLLHVARVHPETARRLLDEDHAARRELCDTSGDDGGNDLEDKEDLVDEDLAVKGLDKGLEAPSGAVLLFKTTEKTLLENENPPATACSLVLDENVPERTIVVDEALAAATGLENDLGEVHVRWQKRAKPSLATARAEPLGLVRFALSGPRGRPIPPRTGLEHVNVAAAVRRRLCGLYIAPNAVYLVRVLGVLIVLRVTSTTAGFLRFNSDIQVEEEAAAMHLDLDDLVFGKAMKSLLSDLEELVALGVSKHAMAPCGALLSGPLGSGKSFCLEQLRVRLRSKYATQERSIDVTGVNCASLLLEAGRSPLPRRVGPRAADLHVILVDDLDAIVSLRDDEAREARTRVVDWLCTLLQRDDAAGGRVFVVGTCADSGVSRLPPRLVASSSATAFPLRLLLDVPSRGERVLLARGFLHDDSNEETIDSLAECTAGFVAGDFALLARSWDPQRESVETMLVRAASTRPRALASAGDIQEAQRAANALPELAGYKEVRERLRQLIQWQWLQPDSSRRLGAQSPTGILLHGPSGCGKTLLAHKLGQMAACNFVSVKSSELVSKYVGESERLIRDLFARARRAAPCILFFDELDSIATRRDLGTGGLQQTSAASNRVLGTFLNELDGIDTQQGLLVLGACSRADALDAALLRPGRLGTAVHVPLPNEEDRRAIFHTMRTPWAPGVDLDLLAQELEGYSCAEVRAVNTEAVLAAMRASSNPGDPLALEVTREHIEFALERVQALRA